jgi:hypothetical protein
MRRCCQINAQKNNREAAKYHLKKKNIFYASFEDYNDVKLTLEKILLDIKSMETHRNVKNILEEVVKTSEKLKMDVNEFDEIAEKFREKSDHLKEANDLLNEYNADNFNVCYF